MGLYRFTMISFLIASLAVSPIMLMTFGSGLHAMISGESCSIENNCFWTKIASLSVITIPAGAVFLIFFWLYQFYLYAKKKQ